MNELANGLGSNKVPIKKHVTWLAVTGMPGSFSHKVVDLIAEYYRNKGIRVKTARLPFDKHLRTEILPNLKSSYAKMLLCATDNNVFAEQLETWQEEYDLIITDGSFWDSFIQGAIKRYSYKFIGKLNQINKLPKADKMIHLVASAETAYDRIMNDPDSDKDKSLSLDYIKNLEEKMNKGFNDIIYHNTPDLDAFDNTINILIDTTNYTPEETFESVKVFIERLT